MEGHSGAVCGAPSSPAPWEDRGAHLRLCPVTSLCSPGCSRSGCVAIAPSVTTATPALPPGVRTMTHSTPATSPRPPMRKTRRRKTNRPRKTRLDRLIEEAIVDAYGESEQLVGLHTMIENNLALPFETMVLGVPVTVVRVDLTQREEIVAVCRRAGVRQTVPILDLPLPSRRPAGAEWIDAYRRWASGK